MGTFAVVVGEYVVSGTVGSVPPTYDSLKQNAKLAEDLGLGDPSGTSLVVSVASSVQDWPFLVVAFRFDPGPQAGFNPGVVVVPEERILLLGAGETVLAYDLSGPRRLWLDSADTGFWGWRRFEDVIVMSAELEMAAWDVRGNKLWSTFVEPPWDYEVRDSRVELDVMGNKSSFPLRTGPVR